MTSNRFSSRKRKRQGSAANGQAILLSLFLMTICVLASLTLFSSLVSFRNDVQKDERARSTAFATALEIAARLNDFARQNRTILGAVSQMFTGCLEEPDCTRFLKEDAQVQLRLRGAQFAYQGLLHPDRDGPQRIAKTRTCLKTSSARQTLCLALSRFWELGSKGLQNAWNHCMRPRNDGDFTLEHLAQSALFHDAEAELALKKLRLFLAWYDKGNQTPRVALPALLPHLLQACLQTTETTAANLSTEASPSQSPPNRARSGPLRGAARTDPLVTLKAAFVVGHSKTPFLPSCVARGTGAHNSQFRGWQNAAASVDLCFGQGSESLAAFTSQGWQPIPTELLQVIYDIQPR